MGSHLLFAMPRTGGYRRVIGLLGDSAGGGGAAGVSAGSLEQVADATLDASLDGLELARGDEGLAYCVYLMVRVARAAREPALLEALAAAGIRSAGVISGLPDVPIVVHPADYDTYDLTSGFTDAVDRHLRLTRRRTDVGELAQLSAAESLLATCAEVTETLFGVDARDVRGALLALSTDAGFASLAHDFFARFARRYLEYHLSRELSNHVGPGRRFADADAHNEFLRQLDEHCRACTSVVRDFARDWYRKHDGPAGEPTLGRALGFVAHAVGQVREALGLQEGRPGAE